jgi:hypothetical protein
VLSLKSGSSEATEVGLTSEELESMESKELRDRVSLS